MAEQTTKFTEFVLNKEQELRIEVDFDVKVKLLLVSGQAEILGASLAVKKEYIISECKLPIFTWQGCVIQIYGNLQHAYVADETPMISYLNIHMNLNKLRQQAREQDKPGPRVIVVGPTDVGKSSLCRILTNYCVRANQQALFVDLDVGQGAVTLPGSICAVPLERVIDPEQGFESTVPLVYFYGHTSPGDNSKLFYTMLNKLAAVLEQRLTNDPQINSTGMIINTCGWVEGVGYQTMMHSIKEFKASLVLVLGDERLYSEIIDDPNLPAGLTVLKLGKSGGVVARDPRYRRRTRNLKIREYFYGSKQDLAPHRIVIPFNELELYQVGQTHVAPSSALPIGETRKVDETRVTRIEASPELTYSVLGVSYADTAAGSTLLDFNVAGFVYVDEVDMTRKRLSVLSPSPGRLPKRLLMLGSLKWLE